MGVADPADRSFNETYKAEIEALKEAEIHFEKEGDRRFLHHPDPEARLLWAFYRPSGSHPMQVSDPDIWVSIMAFNHSRLRPLERFSRLHPQVIGDESLRIKVGKRARMLFRALADEDFTELVEVLHRWPQYTPLACDQIANGRKMNENLPVDLPAATKLLEMIQDHLTDPVLQAIKFKLPDIAEMELDELSGFLERLENTLLHPLIQQHYEESLSSYIQQHALHKIQTLALQKRFHQALGNISS